MQLVVAPYSKSYRRTPDLAGGGAAVVGEKLLVVTASTIHRRARVAEDRVGGFGIMDMLLRYQRGRFHWISIHNCICIE